MTEYSRDPRLLNTEPTPGPWGVFPHFQNPYIHGLFTVKVVGQNWDVIAEKLTLGDARLISAAPDLLAACRSYLDNLNEPLISDALARSDAVVKAIQDAVAKAEGKPAPKPRKV